MVTHAAIQTYKQNYCMQCITGSFGCRWQRYKQSTFYSSKMDLFWVSFLVLCGAFIIIWFYFWLVAKNDLNDFNWFLYTQLRSWYSWYGVMLGLCSAAFVYIVLMWLLALFHVIAGYQLFMHIVHRVLLVLMFGGCIATVVIIDILWSEEWAVQRISLQMFGPFLHIGAVVLMTLLSWIIIERWFYLEKLCVRIPLLITYIVIMVGLYLSPLFIQSPCVTNSIPKMPLIFAHRGAAAIAPENTKVAFQQAIKHGSYGVETDVRISYDGTPFVLHDSNLRRTTNILDVLPNRSDDNAAMFNFSQLALLNAGSWFTRTDPFGTVGSLSEAEKSLYKNQSVPKLEEILSLVRSSNVSIMMDVRPPPDNHPYHLNYLNTTVNLILKMFSNQPQNIYWLEDVINYTWTGFTLTIRGDPSLPTLNKTHSHSVNAQYSDVSAEEIREYRKNNISVNIYVVNSPWLFSYYWCLGVTSVATDQCHILSKEENPVWIMSPGGFHALWISADVVSVLVVVIIFIVHGARIETSRFNPETLHLQQPKTIQTRSRVMREKLLSTAEEIETETGNVARQTETAVNTAYDDGNFLTSVELNQLRRTEVKVEMN